MLNTPSPKAIRNSTMIFETPISDVSGATFLATGKEVISRFGKNLYVNLNSLAECISSQATVKICTSFWNTNSNQHNQFWNSAKQFESILFNWIGFSNSWVRTDREARTQTISRGPLWDTGMHSLVWNFYFKCLILQSKSFVQEDLLFSPQSSYTLQGISPSKSNYNSPNNFPKAQLNQHTPDYLRKSVSPNKANAIVATDAKLLTPAVGMGPPHVVSKNIPFLSPPDDNQQYLYDYTMLPTLPQPTFTSTPVIMSKSNPITELVSPNQFFHSILAFDGCF